MPVVEPRTTPRVEEYERLRDHLLEAQVTPESVDVSEGTIGLGARLFMALAGLFKAGVIEWVSAMTYQSASGAGAKNMRELVSQMGVVHAATAERLADPASAILDIDRVVTETLRGGSLPVEHFG